MTLKASRWRRWALAAASIGVTATGCGNNSIPPTQAVVARTSLTSFSGPNACKDLEAYIEDTAVLQMRTQLEANRDEVGGWGWWGGFAGRGGLEDANLAGAAAPTSGQAAPTNYTTTNNQVAGVDEADFVKNDGTRIFVVSGQKLYATKSWPAADLSLQGSLKIEGYPRDMFLEGTDRAVVFSSVYTWMPLSHSRGDVCDAIDCGFYSSNSVKVTVVDVSDMTNLRTVDEYFLPGQYNSARKVGHSVRLVMADGLNFPDGFSWWPTATGNWWNDKVLRKDAYNKLIDQNEKLIRAQTLADWQPASVIKSNGVKTIVPQDCSAFARVNAPTRLGTVSVTTINLAKPANIDRTSILAEPGEIYASEKNLYVATRHWWWWPAPGQKDTTYLHKFDISSPDAALYVASGTVDGHIVDQFSMDESPRGDFRVVTSIGMRVADQENPNNWWGRIETVNRLSVLGEQDGSLDVIGQSEDLAKGETVQSSRIVGDKAFVVTYRQVDPLFTFDLSDPRNPRKMGELKIPGFSTYMHPIDANHLLTIGTYTPEPVAGQATDWRARALQLAIFDVSDLSNPKQTFVQLVGTAYSWSEAQYEHKAFNYFPAKKLLAIPFSDWSYNYTNENEYWSSFRSDLRVFNVDVNTGFTATGAINVNDMYQVQHYYNWTYYYTPSVRRSVMADDFVYAISDSGIRVANVANLSVPLKTIGFDHLQYP